MIKKVLVILLLELATITSAYAAGVYGRTYQPARLSSPVSAAPKPIQPSAFGHSALPAPAQPSVFGRNAITRPLADSVALRTRPLFTTSGTMYSPSSHTVPALNENGVAPLPYIKPHSGDIRRVGESGSTRGGRGGLDTGGGMGTGAYVPLGDIPWCLFALLAALYALYVFFFSRSRKSDY